MIHDYLNKKRRFHEAGFEIAISPKCDVTGVTFNFFNQLIHFSFPYFCSIHPTHVSAVTLPSSRYINKFTSQFTGPFDIIT
jgi:hypothetical protein